MAQRPLIGVSTSELRAAEGAHFSHQSEPPRRMLALGTAYLDAVASAGGIPVILSPLPGGRIGDVLERLDGICLSGGPDVDPSCYGQAAHPELGPLEPEIDIFELALARAAKRNGIPLLAICRGLQVLNVSRGGTLIQHVPDRHEGIDHRQTSSASSPTHAVEVDGTSLLASLVGGTRVEANSFHHQAVDDLGVGLRPVAWSADGLVEALEAPAEPFTLGVQWHAECLTACAPHAALFEGLVAAAEERGSLASRAAA